MSTDNVLHIEELHSFFPSFHDVGFIRITIYLFFSCDKISFPILGFCNATWDGFLCWPFTPPGVEAKQLCPENVKGILRGRELFVGFFIEKNVLSVGRLFTVTVTKIFVKVHIYPSKRFHEKTLL